MQHWDISQLSPLPARRMEENQVSILQLHTPHLHVQSTWYCVGSFSDQDSAYIASCGPRPLPFCWRHKSTASWVLCKQQNWSGEGLGRLHSTSLCIQQSLAVIHCSVIISEHVYLYFYTLKVTYTAFLPPPTQPPHLAPPTTTPSTHTASTRVQRTAWVVEEPKRRVYNTKCIT